MGNIPRKAAPGSVDPHGTLIRITGDLGIKVSFTGKLYCETTVKLILSRSDLQGKIQHTASDTRDAFLFPDREILYENRVGSEGFNLAYRPLAEAVVSDFEFPRKSHLPKKRQIVGRVLGAVPVLHPGNHNSAAVRCQQRLCCIKIKTIIDCMYRFFQKTTVFSVKLPDMAGSPVARMKFHTGRMHV